MSDQIFWYITRSSSLVAWMAASLSILVGLMTSSRALGRRPTIPWLVDLHRMLAAVSVTFVGVHMLSLALDGFAKFGLADLLIPWAATVPGLTRSSMAYGVIAAWILIAVQVTSLVKDRIPETLWRTVHLGSFGTLGLGTLHAYQAGSDTDNPIVVSIGVSTLTAIILASMARLVRRRRPPPGAPVPQPGPARPIQRRPGQRPPPGAGNPKRGPGPGRPRPNPTGTRPATTGRPQPRRGPG